MLSLDARGFLYGLAALVAYRLLTRQINLSGLLSRKTDGGAVSPERVQLLLATMALSVKYLVEVAHNSSGAMPDVDANWLYVFGGSSGIYASVKAWTTLRNK